jgi:hypothetical protein
LPGDGVVVFAVEGGHFEGVGAGVVPEPFGQEEKDGDAGGVVDGAGRAEFGVNVGGEDDAGASGFPLRTTTLKALEGIRTARDSRAAVCRARERRPLPSSSERNTEGMSKSPSSKRGKG